MSSTPSHERLPGLDCLLACEDGLREKEAVKNGQKRSSESRHYLGLGC